MRKLSAFILLFGLSLFWSGVISAQVKTISSDSTAIMLEKMIEKDPGNTAILMKAGMFFQQMGSSGDKKAVKKSEKIFKKLLQLEPENAEALCWLGSVLTLKGRDAKFPFNKVKFVNNGLKKMDRAVELDSCNISIRMIRGNTAYALPGFFNRMDTAVEDFEFLVNLKESDANSLDDTSYESILYRLGSVYKERGDLDKARECLEKAVISGKTKYAEKAKELLEQIKG